MEASMKQVVSMLVSSDKITLFTMTGELIEVKNDGDYDTAKIAEYLTPRLSGTNSVELNLADYSKVAKILPADLEAHGIEVTQVINGREVQGIFYPRKVAVSVNVGGEKVNIPDIENLLGHIQRASAEQSPSVANFLKRLAPVLQKRKHSGEDLMKFIKLSEMPLTNDGRIIAYKRVNKAEQDYFKDCHTGLVKQRVGSRVIMKVDLVDSSRHNSCSTGLHVANLGYMKGFNGAHTLIVLVNPEDFIAVPVGEDTKARVCAYEIIGTMSNSAHDKVNTGSHVQGDITLKQLIKNAVEGNHIRPFEEIEVGERGAIVKVTPLTGGGQPPVKAPVAKSSGESLLADKQPEQAVRDVVAITRAAQAKNPEMPEEVKTAFQMIRDGISKSEIARKLVTSTHSIGRWIEKFGDPFSLVSPPQEEQSSDEEDEQDAQTEREFWENEATKEEAPVNDENFAKLVQSSEAPKPVTKAEQMRKLYNNWVLGGKKEEDLKAMKLFKSASKKSWNALGLTAAEEQKILDAE